MVVVVVMIVVVVVVMIVFVAMIMVVVVFVATTTRRDQSGSNKYSSVKFSYKSHVRERMMPCCQWFCQYFMVLESED